MNLEQVQLQLEQEQTDIGVKKYNDALTGAKEGKAESRINPQNRLMVSAIKPMSDFLKQYKAESESGKAGRRASALKIIEGIDPDVVAYMVAQVVINGISSKVYTGQIESRIAGNLRDYAMFTKFKAEKRGLFEYVHREGKKSSDVRYQANRMRHYAVWAGIDMSEDVKADGLTGAFLLESFIQATGLVTKQNVKKSGKTRQLLVANPDVIEWLQNEHKDCALLNPYYLPMVVEPSPWTDPYNGGYRSVALPIMKTKQAKYLEELEGAKMTSVYDAVNALQSTAWRVNLPILEVAQHIWDNVDESNVLPRRANKEVPLPPVSGEKDVEVFKKEHAQAWSDWKCSATAIHTQNNRMDSKRIAVSQRLWMANKFKEFDAIYFPHTMDWRGRMYPVVQMLNPQSDDLGKALLEFGEGKEMGDDGEYWLKIHLANCYGVDKVSMEERVQWTDDHATIMSLVANDPLTYRMWQDADSPWQFLAGCLEWEAYKSSGIGSTYISHLSINMDGSCNGLQNFSAMLKDAIGGKATNLIALDTPADIYTEVMNVVQSKVTEDITNPDTSIEVKILAHMWDGKLVRKLVKRQVMTLPYGATEFGMRDQLKAELHTMKGDGKDILGTDDHVLAWEAIGYLTTHIWNSIGEVVVASRQAMDWLKASAKVASEANLPIYWTTPSGLPVVQDYRKPNTKYLDTVFNKVRIKRELTTLTNTLDSRKQVNGVAPNFVHSMDASHMVATINRCLDIGITSFCMIHDSYGTHAGNVGKLQAELRQAFIDQYSKDVLGNFKIELEQQTNLGMPEMPKVGTLDLEGVKDSKYFFA